MDVAQLSPAFWAKLALVRRRTRSRTLKMDGLLAGFGQLVEISSGRLQEAFAQELVNGIEDASSLVGLVARALKQHVQVQPVSFHLPECAQYLIGKRLHLRTFF